MRFLKKRVVAQQVGYHPAHVMKLVKEGKFPRPVRLNDRAVVFVEEEIDAWMEARVKERGPDRYPEVA